LSDTCKHNNKTNYSIYLYGGFYPQIRYQIGETYGKTTSRLLTDPNVRKSPCSVLAPLGKPRFLEDFSGTKHPSNQMLDQNYSYFPGYTGKFFPGCQGEWFLHLRAVHYPHHPPPPHLPRPQNPHPCCRSPRTGWGSGRDHPLELHAAHHRSGISEALTRSGRLPLWFFGRIEGVPLDAVTETVDLSRYNQLPQLDVPNLIQRKAISGYTGFVPRFTWIMGVNYLKGVKDAMNEFDRNQFMVRNPVWNFGKRLPQTYWPNNKIYSSAGLIPFYTGFVPSNPVEPTQKVGGGMRRLFPKKC
uniref:Ciliary microtubule inner protein 2A-C-like domain-containing protein n=1 Tax=Terrapene triunguis TaxID=2587831 RepID=A0A674IEI5_9SAUR